MILLCLQEKVLMKIKLCATGALRIGKSKFEHFLFFKVPNQVLPSTRLHAFVFPSELMKPDGLMFLDEGNKKVSLVSYLFVT